ncbi:hypothetical protein OC846_003445 [Tilletia horrida]|uniref:Sodium/calcium exchanger membrane region domain-containing protein n=1 Tax=Tilletia horrida TaxID=155126 RepID=A0AAN6JRR4_9BASI|nr:hypothetical protein OC846_003445 [Tilletia horrida]
MPAVLSRLTPSSTTTSTSNGNHVGQTLYLLLLLALAAILLERGCDLTLDNISQVALVARIDQTLVSLLTAGGEWEELAVVIAAIKQRRAALALGNIVGSAISNILGAFSLGLICAASPSSSTSDDDDDDTLQHGFRYADIDPHTGLTITRVDPTTLIISTAQRPDPTRFTFDRSAKTYATIQFLITTIVAPLLYFAQASADLYDPIQPRPSHPHTRRRRLLRKYIEWSPTAIRVLASALIALFVLYLLSVGIAIYRGWIAPPPDSDSDSSSSSSSPASSISSSSERAEEEDAVPDQHRPNGLLAGMWAKRFWARHRGPSEASLVSGGSSSSAPAPPPSYGAVASTQPQQPPPPPPAAADAAAAAAAAAAAEQQEQQRRQRRVTRRRRRQQRAADDSSPITHWLFTHYPSSRLWLSILPRLGLTLLGLLLLALSGSMLSSVGSRLASLWGWSDTLVGLTLLSFLTTIPEKALSAVAGSKGLGGALAGASAGSNIFLLSLCAGVALFGLADEREAAAAAAAAAAASAEGGEVRIPLLKWEEMVLLWVSSLVLCIIVCLTGGRRWHGWVLLLAYIVYLVAELSVWKR